MGDKPKMPKDRPKIRFEVEAELLSDFDRYSDGAMLMRMADTEATIKAGEEEVGTVGGAMGGTVFVKSGRRLWVLRSIPLFEAVAEAEQSYLNAEV